MATKKDLIEAQTFSRRRLLTAFTGGAPGGKELEPSKPLIAVITGIVLSVMLVLGGVFYGLIRPGLPNDWQNNRLIVAGDTGARFVSIEGVLYPVVNTASARLLIPAGQFEVITTDRGTLSGIEIGRSIGIVGAPDELPEPSALIHDAWAACLPEGRTSVVALSSNPVAAPAAGVGLAVTRGDEAFVVAGDRRYAVDDEQVSAVLRAAGLGTVGEREVEGRWLELYTEGEPLAPLVIDGAGAPVTGTSLRVGEAVHAAGSPEADRYLVTAAGELAPLSPLAYQLYLLGTGAELGEAREISPAEIAGLTTASARAGGADWPTDVLGELSAGDIPCAVLDTSGEAPTTRLGMAERELPDVSAAGAVAMQRGAGAVVAAGGSGTDRATTTFVIDATGTAFPVPGSDPEPLQRLGYGEDDVTPVTNAWIAFFPTGPALSPAAAADTAEPASADGG
ncbi:type VII secretion protein EccB [Agromyces sp. CFH 90414]|uniref:Type VII secretion protein EccB n=1 Tax=Agromyces agglutinans TaxID=2662258 RepID=A0A6I2F3S9_9MICO|nr:type VII secretion protein EccB [Agromyces agglutinans]MRG58881.1 type VII secretion protein EccB [Agromyces agglutinans]